MKTDYSHVKFASKYLDKVIAIEKTGWKLEDVNMVTSMFKFHKDVKVRVASGKRAGSIITKRKYKSVRMNKSEWKKLSDAADIGMFYYQQGKDFLMGKVFTITKEEFDEENKVEKLSKTTKKKTRSRKK